MIPWLTVTDHLPWAEPLLSLYIKCLTESSYYVCGTIIYLHFTEHLTVPERSQGPYPKSQRR